MNRPAFWKGIAIVALLYGAVFALLVFADLDPMVALLGGQPSGLLHSLLTVSIVAFIAWAPLQWTLVALAAKRLHDLNHTGWWCVVPYLLQLPFSHVLLSKVFITVLLVTLGSIRGCAGSNEYGRPPLFR